MTLILGALTNLHVFHASDRLTTVTSRAKSQPWDIASNKTIIVVGHNCWLVIGYTGLAYLDGKPTDQFIAEAVTGVKDLSHGGYSGWAPPSGGMHYRAITDRIRDALRAAYKRLDPTERAYATTILGVGLQQARPTRIQHVMFELAAIGDTVTRDELGGRHQAVTRFHVSAVGSWDPLVHSHMREELRQHGAESPDRFRQAMVEAVQLTGQRSDVVGEDVLSVELQPTNNKIFVEFTKAPTSSAPPIPASLGEAKEWTDHPRVYTPYVVVPGMILHPAVASPGTQKLFGNGLTPLEYTVSGKDLSPEVGRFFYSSHPRKPPPR